jgi:hypothetical protein
LIMRRQLRTIARWVSPPLLAGNALGHARPGEPEVLTAPGHNGFSGWRWFPVRRPPRERAGWATNSHSPMAPRVMDQLFCGDAFRLP